MPLLDHFRPIALIAVDVVTERHDSLQDEIQDMLELDAAPSVSAPLFAAAYRTIAEQSGRRLEIWSERLSVGQPLPALPLWLESDLAVPLDLETTYTTACRRLRIAVAGEASG